eukprot:TRINITY_DN16729_c0_g1_i2.p1 TRINITY_DN16729_c0_g1~~TRINITY_DN16729_c0_g1_i2.p1  ORF type:complete len:136 (+),score=7.50 TRINITY_DN16729_c0_g1_i2:197-604(+)
MTWTSPPSTITGSRRCPSLCLVAATWEEAAREALRLPRLKSGGGGGQRGLTGASRASGTEVLAFDGSVQNAGEVPRPPRTGRSSMCSRSASRLSRSRGSLATSRSLSDASLRSEIRQQVQSELARVLAAEAPVAG